MLKQVPISKIVGKTITGISDMTYCEQVAIVFSDGTFALLRAKQSYDNVELDNKEFDILDFNCAEAVSLGIATQEEIDKARQEKESLAKEQARKWEIGQLKALQTKYPGV